MSPVAGDRSGSMHCHRPRTLLVCENGMGSEAIVGSADCVLRWASFCPRRRRWWEISLSVEARGRTVGGMALLLPSQGW
jgi:hypothetical protein